jgi:hypothetical protein
MLGALVRFRILVLLAGFAAPASAIVVGYNPVGTSNFGDPNSSTYVVSLNEVADGVNLNSEVLIESTAGTCTGSLLSDGMSILTAAHCLDPSATASGVLSSEAVIYFDQGCGSGFYCGAYTSTTFFIDPGYLADNGNMCSAPGVPGAGIACAAFQGDDLAVIRLSSPAPASSVGYSLFSGSSIDLTTPIELAGAGYTGAGCIDGNWDGSNCNPQPGSPDPYAPEISAVMRQGETQYVGGCVGCTNLLIAQFNPNSTLPDQVEIGGGDSGGGSFYNGQLIGVHDFTDCSSGSCPITGDSYFGDTYVGLGSSNAAWIESVEVSIPEPAPPALLAIGLAAVLLMRRRTSQRSSMV